VVSDERDWEAEAEERQRDHAMEMAEMEEREMRWHGRGAAVGGYLVATPGDDHLPEVVRVYRIPGTAQHVVHYGRLEFTPDDARTFAAHLLRAFELSADDADKLNREEL
jgi:hypothetical protein